MILPIIRWFESTMTENLKIMLTVKNNHREKSGLIVESSFSSVWIFWNPTECFHVVCTKPFFLKYNIVDNYGPLYSHKGLFHLEVNMLEVNGRCVSLLPCTSMGIWIQNKEWEGYFDGINLPNWEKGSTLIRKVTSWVFVFLIRDMARRSVFHAFWRRKRLNLFSVFDLSIFVLLIF